jgi:hypothetical protein
VLKELDVAASEAHKLSAILKTMQSCGDEEAFFLQNDVSLATEKVAKLEAQKMGLEKVLKEADQLLKVVNPRLVLSLETGFMGERRLPINESGSMAPPLARISTVASFDSDKPLATQVPQATGDFSIAGPGEFMPPPKRIRLVGPQALPPADKAIPTSSRRSVPKATSTLAALSSGMPIASRSKHAKVPALCLNESKGTGTALQRDSAVKADVWRAPKDQDGSGRSKLNEKFAGRY